MNSESLETMPSLSPLEFFALEGEIGYAKVAPSLKILRRSFLLPDLTSWLGEEKFADLSLAWNETGIFAAVFVDKPFEEASYPRFSEGDAVELFFDTRDLKSAGFATRFCHHFLFLPEPIQEIQAQEITHFRTEETHPLADAADLGISTTFYKKSYELNLFIPAHCLHGFDPHTFERIGFTYRIHRLKRSPQHFALSSQHFSLEQHPRLWASFKLGESR